MSVPTIRSAKTMLKKVIYIGPDRSLRPLLHPRQHRPLHLPLHLLPLLHPRQHRHLHLPLHLRPRLRRRLHRLATRISQSI